MDVFFKLPVTSLGNYRIPASDVLTVAQTLDTATAIYYKSGVVLTLTHADDSGTFVVRDELFAGIKAALKQHWQQVDEVAIVPSFAVSAVVVTNIIVPAT